MALPQGNYIVDMVRNDANSRVLRNAQVVTLERAQVTTVHSARMRTVDFPVSALLSVVGILADGSTAEVASIGREGFVEVDAALRHDVAKRTSTCQFRGEVVRVPLPDFQQGLLESPPFAELVYHAVRARIFITEQVKICVLRHTVPQRLARWLLLAADRTNLEELPVTHEFLSNVLGTRRATITAAAFALQEAGAIRYRPGAVAIQERRRLQECACECYEMCDDALKESASSATR